MPTGLKEFGDIAKKLSVNPLGIIALFIVLVYGIAALVLVVSVSSFEPGERLPLIWFLVGFPPIVLFTFAWLVARHHVKLYAPKDYPDPTQFLQTLDTAQQRKKLESEVELLEDKKPVSKVQGLPTSTSIPRNILMARVILAEDLVMRELSAEYGVNIQRQVGLGRDIGVDGMFAKGGEGFGIEVKFFRHSKNVRNVIDSLRQVLDHISRTGWRRFNFILAAVIDDTKTERVDLIKQQIEKSVTDIEMNVEIRFFIFSELAEKYGAALSVNG
jgi:hypothetical protein